MLKRSVLKLVGICFIFKFCYAINVESAVNYNFNQQVRNNTREGAYQHINSQVIKAETNKIALKKSKNKTNTTRNSSAKYLHDKKSKTLPVSINPNFSRMGPSTFNYNGLVNSLGNSEYRLSISEETALGVKQGAVNFSHSY